MTRRGGRGGGRIDTRPLDGRVRDLTLDGHAVVETPAGLVMVRGALPDEQVRVQPLRANRGVRWGKLLQVVQASPDRITPACPLAERCGGCPLMTLGHGAQLSHKRSLLERALAGLGLPGLTLAMESAPRALGYRRRARLALSGRAGAPGRLGYRATGSRELVDVEACPILEPALQDALAAVRAGLLPSLNGPGELALSLGAGGRALAFVRMELPQAPDAYRAAEALSERLGAVALSVQGGAPATWGALAQQGADADGLPLDGPADGFAQANSDVNERLVELVLQLAEPAGADVLELYAGHGNFSMGLAARARHFRAVEGDPRAAEALRGNLARRGLAGARVTTGAVAEHVGQGPLDVVVLDPPRAGARDALPALLARRPARIVYVSCQPPTLRRDLTALHAEGYRVDAAVGLDMFPHTGHVEALVRLQAPR